MIIQMMEQGMKLSKIINKIKELNLFLGIKKYGVGSAHKEGLSYAYKKMYKMAITMDSDGTHEPKYFASSH